METKNLSQFKFVKSNRPVNKRHVATLVKSIKEHGYFKSKPITVNKNMEVSDGQHRLLACLELKIPVHYEIDNIDVNQSMVVLNNTSNNWRLNEFICHYAAMGIPYFVELNNFINEGNFGGVSNQISIFSGISGSSSRTIRNGSLSNRNKKLNETCDIIHFIKPHFKYTLTSYFVRGIVKFITDETTTKKHIEKLKLQTFSIIPCVSADQYYIQFNKLVKKK
jgi:hypothetical protein